nr:hypothetical protein [Tanacetum cinerariifolium]
MSTSHISFSSESDHENTGLSISYIILSDSEAKGVALLTIVLDYVLALDTDTESFEAPSLPDHAPAPDAHTKLLEAPALPDYTLRSNAEFKPSEHDPKESSKEDPSKEYQIEDDEPLPA